MARCSTKTLNCIFDENHGKRITVTQDEFGEVGIDQALVIGADAANWEMNYGCIIKSILRIDMHPSCFYDATRLRQL